MKHLTDGERGSRGRADCDRANRSEVMNKHDWNEFVEANEAKPLTLSLAQRNLIADADQHIDWLESRKRFSEAQVETLTEQCNSLLGALLTMLYHYETGHQDNPEIIRARAAVAGVLGENFDTTKALINVGENHV